MYVKPSKSRSPFWWTSAYPLLYSKHPWLLLPSKLNKQVHEFDPRTQMTRVLQTCLLTSTNVLQCILCTCVPMYTYTCKTKMKWTVVATPIIPALGRWRASQVYREGSRIARENCLDKGEGEGRVQVWCHTPLIPADLWVQGFGQSYSETRPCPSSTVVISTKCF